MRLLLVDDDGVNRYMVSKALQRVGYVVVEVTSAEAALERYNKHDFDLILSEVNLPGMSGIDLLKSIKQEFSETIVILMTADTVLETVIEALRYDAKDFLVKPCSSEDIRESVERGIANARSLLRRRRLLDTIERNVAELSREVAASVRGSAEIDTNADESSQRYRAQPQHSAIRLGPLAVLPGKYQVAMGDNSASLTPTEFDLLLYLAAHRDRVLSCHELVREVRGYSTDEQEAREIIRPHVSNLRRKLFALSDFDLIVNVRGIGYRLGEINDTK